MNEQANTRLVRQAYQSVQAGDFQSLLNALAEDVQWQLPEMENVPFAGTWHGREQVGRFFSTVPGPKISSNLSLRNLSRKVTKWLLWSFLFARQIYRQRFRLSLGHMFGPSKMAK